MLKLIMITAAFYVNDTKVSEGDYISLDGSTGNVYLGQIAYRGSTKLAGDFETFMGWADEIRTLKVYTNADTPRDAKHAVEFGAQGIGLCRTEHMFFAEDRIAAIREMIVSKTARAKKGSS